MAFPIAALAAVPGGYGLGVPDPADAADADFQRRRELFRRAADAWKGDPANNKLPDAPARKLDFPTYNAPGRGGDRYVPELRRVVPTRTDEAGRDYLQSPAGDFVRQSEYDPVQQQARAQLLGHLRAMAADRTGYYQDRVYEGANGSAAVDPSPGLQQIGALRALLSDFASARTNARQVDAVGRGQQATADAHVEAARIAAAGQAQANRADMVRALAAQQQAGTEADHERFLQGQFLAGKGGAPLSAPGQPSALPPEYQQALLQRLLDRGADRAKNASDVLREYADSGLLDGPSGQALLQNLRISRPDQLKSLAEGYSEGLGDKLYRYNLEGFRWVPFLGDAIGAEQSYQNRERTRALLRQYFPELFPAAAAPAPAGP